MQHDRGDMRHHDLPIAAKLREHDDKLHGNAANLLNHCHKLMSAHMALMSPSPRRDEFQQAINWLEREL